MTKQKPTLNQEDIKLLKSIFATKDEVVAFEMHTNQRFEDLENKIKLLPTRDVFLTKMDEVMGELQASHEEQTILSYRVSKHNDDIEDLQNIHPGNIHNFALASNR
ncbi:MAG: hypothetical protein AAB768_00115 [Patescibacteria group bacterium]